MTTIVIVEEGQARVISGEFFAMQMQTVDVWGFPVPAAQMQQFPAGWLARATDEELASISAFKLDDPEVTEGQEVDTQALDVDADGVPFWSVTLREATPPTPFVPQVITRLQAKLALNAAGLLDDVEAFVASADRSLQIYWTETSDIHRDHALITGSAEALRWSDDQVDALFIAAKQIV
ncbi:hypothetical protein BH10PSE5_BH10PSE5_19510 [soil metagenome]